MDFVDTTERSNFFFGLLDDGMKLCIWGGLSKEMNSFWYGGEEGPIKMVTKSVLTFAPWQEKWSVQEEIKGPLPPGFYDGASATFGRCLYTFGGGGRKDLTYSGSLYQLDTATWEWSLLSGGDDVPEGKGGSADFDSDSDSDSESEEESASNAAEGASTSGGGDDASAPASDTSKDASNSSARPMKKAWSKMVEHEGKLVLIGGTGIPWNKDDLQPGSEFKRMSKGKGWTNEIHTFDLTEKVWSSPTVTGTRPPPCQGFSFTKVGSRHAIFFGGLFLGPDGNPVMIDDVYILDLEKMHFAKMDHVEGEAWPGKRIMHSAVCLGSDKEDNPQLLVVGGVTARPDGKREQGLKDVWMLDLKARKWKEVTAENISVRFNGCAVALDIHSTRVDVILYGGSPESESAIADTTVLRFEYSTDKGEWALTEMASKSQLGTSERIEEKKPFSPEEAFSIANTEPERRKQHLMSTVGDKVYVWGGSTKDVASTNHVDVRGLRRFTTDLFSFDTKKEEWSTLQLKEGPDHPAAFYAGAYASDGRCRLFAYGGLSYMAGAFISHNIRGGLYQIDLDSLEWRKLAEAGVEGGPMDKSDSAMVVYDDGGKLAVFGGDGIPYGSDRQPGSVFEPAKFETRWDRKGRGLTNELHVFDLKEGVWSSPEVTGDRPPPSDDLSFTRAADGQAVLITLKEADVNVFFVDLQKMHWTKLEHSEGEPWPETPSLMHNAVCLEYGGDTPHLFYMSISATGKDNFFVIMWLLDVNARKWKKIEVPKEMPFRIGKCTAGINVSPTQTDVVLYGGDTLPADTLMADTTLLHFEKQEHSSDDGSTVKEWVLTGMTDKTKLGKKME